MKFEELKKNMLLSHSSNDSMFMYIIEKKVDSAIIYYCASKGSIYSISEEECSKKDWDNIRYVYSDMSEILGSIDLKIFFNLVFNSSKIELDHEI